MSKSHFTRFIFAALMAAAVVAGGSAQAQTYTVVSDVPDNPEANPAGQITQGRNGDIYAASAANQGDFSVDTSGNFSLLTNSIGGGQGVVLGTDGNLYIARYYNNGCGDVYSMTETGTSTLIAALCGSDGALPASDPVQASNGVLYGTASQGGGTSNDGTIYSLTTSGTLTVLHTFTGTDGSTPYAPLVFGSDGNLYGGTYYGGTNNDGVLFKITPSGTYTVLHNFAGTDGSHINSGLVLGNDGNLYGVTSAGGIGIGTPGVFFKLTNSGTYTVLFNFANPYSAPASSLVQATNGLFYGILGVGNDSQPGWIYSMTTSGTFTAVHEFCQLASCTDGSQANGPLIQHTNGNLYGFTATGGTVNQCNGGTGCGVFYSLNIGAKPFLTLSSTSGKVGSTVGILGAGFTSSSVVKFNGVTATFTLSDTGYITAKVPTGATNGFVTVTTGTTTLKSTKKYTVHNSWASGTTMPTPVAGAAAGTIGTKIYVVGGNNSSGSNQNANQIYNTATGAWTTGATMPTARAFAAAAVVSNTLYVIGGKSGHTQLNVVEAYDATTNTWTTKSSMPTARDSVVAAVEDGKIYVIGGYVFPTGRLATVESYDPATDTWTEEAPLLEAKSLSAVGLVGTTIVSSGGLANSGITNDHEGYNASTNAWSALTAESTARQAACAGAIGSNLYVGGGTNDVSDFNLMESFSVSASKWTTLLTMPQALDSPASAVAGGELYCFGGESSTAGTIVYGNVQIYQP